MNMNLRRIFFLTMLAASTTVAIPPAVAADDEAAGLEELKRALEAPSGAPKGKRTRAIVFDGDASQAPQAAAPSAAAGGALDCAALPPDARSTAVQFPIQFRPGSAVITPGSANTLSEISKILALTPDRCIIVEGHTDAEGNPDRNMNLSRDRANAVVKFIVDRGTVERRRLVPVGKGATDPQKDLDPRDARNRRVVFKVVSG